MRTDLADLPIRAATVPAILITKDSIEFACSLTEKRGMLAKYQQAKKKKSNNARLIAVWPGNYSTHAFTLTEEKLGECIPTDREFFEMHRSI